MAKAPFTYYTLGLHAPTRRPRLRYRDLIGYKRRVVEHHEQTYATRVTRARLTTMRPWMGPLGLPDPQAFGVDIWDNSRG